MFGSTQPGDNFSIIHGLCALSLLFAAACDEDAEGGFPEGPGEWHGGAGAGAQPGSMDPAGGTAGSWSPGETSDHTDPMAGGGGGSQDLGDQTDDGSTAGEGVQDDSGALTGNGSEAEADAADSGEVGAEDASEAEADEAGEEVVDDEDRTGPAPDTTANFCLDGITDFSSNGPFSYNSTSSGRVNMWVPNVPDGCKVPVVHLANGTGARCSTYAAILRRLASHGFLAACYEDTNTGAGTQCIQAIETVRDRYPDLADDKIGSTGHSQGGAGAIMCIYRAEDRWGSSMTYAGHAIQPAHGFREAPSDYGTYYSQIESPIFMFNGSRDSLVSASWVRRGFNALDSGTEAWFYEAVGASHMSPLPTSWSQDSAVSWFRWKLLGDRAACEFFKGLPNNRDWREMAVQNPSDC